MWTLAAGAIGISIPGHLSLTCTDGAAVGQCWSPGCPLGEQTPGRPRAFGSSSRLHSYVRATSRHFNLSPELDLPRDPSRSTGFSRSY
ncbi:hypothetical protein PoB_005011100 [Plakobranchus ocellatus]|uniref:Secreted protein n=1 Tax=Plakobranchus ocellatus TaxID=259542 RepID=A0AAV4BJV2_9GAST|nr:hypothetical protein PoB_005011100 [Plakobranchus ocellatus]